MKKQSLILLILVFIYAVSCSKRDTFSSRNDIASTQIPIPGSVTLIKPLDQAPCQGIENKENNTFRIDFQWNKARNATDYLIKIYDVNGLELLNKSLNGTTVSIALPRNIEFSWNVTAKNKAGESTSKTFTAQTPGRSIKNNMPSINKITVNKEQNSIELTVQDLDGDALFYDAISADNPAFNAAKVYANNQEVENAKGNNQAHQINLKDILWSTTFWLEIRVRDDFGNQVVKKISQRFYDPS